MENNNSEVEFFDHDSQVGGGGSSKNPLSFEFIVLRHISKIMELSTHEFVGGYWNRQLIQLPGGLHTKNETYVPDARACYTQAVDSLHDALSPFFDKPMKSFLTAYTTEEKTIKDKDQLTQKKRELFRAMCDLLKRLNFLKEMEVS